MASYLFLSRQFEEAVMYLSSIAPYSSHEDAFCFNFGVAQAAVGRYSEAEEAFRGVKGAALAGDVAFLAWFARCLVNSGKPR